MSEGSTERESGLDATLCGLPDAAALGAFGNLLLRVLETSAWDLVYIKDASGVYLWVNEAAAKAFGLPREQVVGKDDAQLLGNPRAVAVRSDDVRVMDTQQEMDIEETHWLEGEATIFRTRKWPILNSLGQVTGVVGISRDVTFYKSAERRIEESSDEARRILNSISDGFFAVDQDGTLTHLNERAACYLGLRPDLVLGKSLRQSCPDLTGTPFDKGLSKAAKTGVPQQIEFLDERTGSWLELHAYPHERGISLLFRDISDRKSTEQALRESEERFRDLADNISQHAWMADTQGRVYWFNRRWLEYSGRNEADEIQEDWQTLLHPDHWHRVIDRFLQSVNNGTDWEDSFPLRRHDGVFRWFLARAMPIRDAAGVVVRWFGTHTDITELREAEVNRARLLERLRVAYADAQRERGQLRAVFESVSEGIAVYQMDGTLLMMNEAEAAMHGFETAEAMRRDMEQLLPEFQLVEGGKKLPPEQWPSQRAIRGERFTDWQLHATRTDIGREWDFSFSGSPVFEDGQQVLAIVVTRDITRSKQIETAVRESEERYRRLAESIPHIVWTADGSGHVDYVNGASAQFFGPSRAIPFSEGWEEVVHPDDVERLFERYRQCRGNGLDLQVDARMCNAQGEWRWMRLVAVPQRGGDGRIDKWIGTITDVQEQKEMEAELERRVRERTNELHSANNELEGFTYSVAHDLRAPLRAIGATSRILLDELGPKLDDEYRDLLNRQSHNSQKLALLIDDLLKLSRVSRLELVRADVDLTSLAEDVAAMTRGDLCRFEIEPNMRANADPTLLKLLLENLIENACKYSPEGGTIRVGARQGTFFVSDEGIGFEMQYADRIFRPFERLHRDQEFAGTGIGLANVQRIVERHNGRVWAESEPGKGSTFYFTLGES